MEKMNELIQRWDAFLQKIEERFHASLQQAEDMCMEQLEETDYDYYTVIRSWHGMKAQIEELIRKIQDTWTEKVEPEMKVLGDFWMSESYKSSKYQDRLSEDLMHFQRMLEGKLSEKFYNHVVVLADQDFGCSQCGAKIMIRKDLFKSHYVPCPFCMTVNTFEPETKYLQIGWNIVDNLAAYRSERQYAAMMEALEAIQRLRPPVQEELWTRYEQAYTEYYKTYFENRMALKSDAADRFEEDMRRKLLELKEYVRIHKKTI